MDCLVVWRLRELESGGHAVRVQGLMGIGVCRRDSGCGRSTDRMTTQIMNVLANLLTI